MEAIVVEVKQWRARSVFGWVAAEEITFSLIVA
jgi:hypothetical protein